MEDIVLQSIKEKEHLMDIDTKKVELDCIVTQSDIEEKKWRSCCFEIHSESSQFFAKVAVSLGVMSLCSYQLITLNDCSNQSLYSSLLSSIITFWLAKK